MSELAPPPAFVLAHYKLGPKVGAGAAGSVFRAVDARSGNDVVVKFFDGEDDGFGPWASEMRLALRFRHQNIVPCLDLGFDSSFALWAMVFALAKGGSLRRAIASGQRFPLPRIGKLLWDVASALAYAHGHGVVHRDVKPENILARSADPDSDWLLTDFGSGRFLARGEVAQSIAGSVEYMAPEVFAGTSTAASDQYSLGIVGLELWLGRIPAAVEREALRADLADQPGLLGIIGRLIADDPRERFSSLEEVAFRLKQELEHMKNGEDVIESLSRYLKERHGIGGDALLQLRAEWQEKGSFSDFLVSKSLLPRATARTLDAVRNGYVDLSVDTVLGLQGAPAPKAVEAEKSAPLPSAPLPAKPEPAVESKPASPPVSELPVSAPARVAEPSRPAKPSKPVPGMRLGRYTLQEPLGEGATATVFRSFHELLSIPVAIKVFEPIDSSTDPETAQRFRREAQTLIRLEHPHVVRVIDVDIIEPFPFIVMEYVGETTLSSQIKNLGRMPAMRIAQIGVAVADALDAAWKEGLLHRDVKPSNIIERKDGHIKLVDFGIAVTKTPEGGIDDPQAALNLISGTPCYIAPEQVQNPSGIDFRADMYALGATLYHAAIGRPPFLRPTAHDTIWAQINDEPPSITQLDPSFDLHLAWTIHRMLRKRPEDRFASWAEVKEALSHTLFFQDQLEISMSTSNAGGANRSTAETKDLALPSEPAPPTAVAVVEPEAAVTPAQTAAALLSPSYLAYPQAAWRWFLSHARSGFRSWPMAARISALAGVLLVAALLLARILGGG